MRFLKTMGVFLVTGLAVTGAFYAERAVAEREATAEAAAKPAATKGASSASKPVPADGYLVRPARIEEVVPANGTLAPFESVDIVAELPRRLVEIKAEEGTRVKKGDLLFKLDDRDLKAQWDQLKVKRHLAETTEIRLRDLLSTKAISQQQYDEANNALEAVDAETKVLDVTIDKTEIKAPFDGMLGSRNVSLGAWIEPNRPLITLTALDPLKLNFTLPERYSTSIKPGQEFTFRVPGLADELRGKVDLIEPAIDAASRSLRVRGIVANSDGVLRPGSFVVITMTLANIDNGLMVPTQAVVPSLRGQSVYVVVDGKAQLREVELGVRTADNVQVLRGLSEGETVVITNLLRMRPGATVDLKSVTNGN